MARLSLIFGLALVLLIGCANPLWVNSIAYLDPSQAGLVSVTIVNDTPYRAVFFWGGYNPLDPGWDGYGTLEPSGTFAERVVLESSQTTQSVIPCFRQIDLAGFPLQRAVELSGNEEITAEQLADDAAWQGIGFSDLLETDDDPEQPTIGYSDPVTFLLGVNYSCADVVTITISLKEGTTDEFEVTLEVEEE